MALPPPLEEELNDRISMHGLDELAESIRGVARECFHLNLGKPGEGRSGESRIGGSPDLPPAFHWPRNAAGQRLTFVMQLNLHDLASLAATVLPASGMLYFFVGRTESASTPEAVVLHAPGHTALQRTPQPPESERTGSDHSISRPHTIRPIHGLDLPDHGSAFVRELQTSQPKEFVEAYRQLVEDLNSIPRIPRGFVRRVRRLLPHPLVQIGRALLHLRSSTDLERSVGKLLGSLPFSQVDLVRTVALLALGKSRVIYSTHQTLEQFDAANAEWLAQGRELDPAGSAECREQLAWFHANRPVFEAECARWRFFWRVRSNFRAGLCIWDAGSFDMMIRDADLSAHRFDAVSVKIETS